MTQQYPPWDPIEAERYEQIHSDHPPELAHCLYAAHLLGTQKDLVLHGGGNISAKVVVHDELEQRSFDAIAIKASGCQMADLKPSHLPLLKTRELRALATRSNLDKDHLIGLLRRQLLHWQSPNPSVESLLHIFLPAKFIVHTHPDAILALVNQSDLKPIIERIFGSRMAVVPYKMPGFGLAQVALEVFESHPKCEGLTLDHHGLVTFGGTMAEAYRRTCDLVTIATSELEPVSITSPEAITQGVTNTEDKQRFLNRLRGSLSRHNREGRRFVLHTRTDPLTLSMLNSSRVLGAAVTGPATPDHVIHTRHRPLVLDSIAEDIDAALVTYGQSLRNDIEGNVQRQLILDPLPTTITVPGFGLITSGTHYRSAEVTADLFTQTLTVARSAIAYGSYEPLTLDHLFEMESWGFEREKLRSGLKPLAGHVTVVTGACGGIGSAIARRFAAAGSNLVLTDRAHSPIEDLLCQLEGRYPIKAIAVEGDLCERSTATDIARRATATFGGIDILISNAGRAWTAPIHQSDRLLTKSLAINTLSHQYLSSACVNVMLAQDTGGCLLFNTSKAALNPGKEFGAYAIAKAALVALMRQYALEYGHNGIRSNAVNADRIRTPLFDDALLKARCEARGLTVDAYFKSNLMQTEVFASDVADAFYHLTQSQKTTGTLFCVDGGNIAAAPR